jgi:hypothetical protein
LYYIFDQCNYSGNWLSIANIAWEEIAKQASELSPPEKAQLIAWLSTSLSQELSETQQNDSKVDSANDGEIPPTWTEQEIHELLNPKPTTLAEAIAWLEANPPTEPWGDIRDDEDAAEYVHRMRRKTWSTPNNK